MNGRDPEVSAVVREWLAVAEGDLASARILLKGDLTRGACFHAQQAVEKWLKALLVLNGTNFGKTHDIGELLRLLPAEHRPGLTPQAAFELTRSAVGTRYPDMEAPSREDGQRLLQYAEQVREFVRAVLPPDLLNP